MKWIKCNHCDGTGWEPGRVHLEPEGTCVVCEGEAHLPPPKETQREMFDQRFDGSNICDPRDRPRLSGQLRRIFVYMKDGNWYTLRSVAEGTKAPESSVSAQIRNLRKKRFGKHKVDKKYLGNGLYHYRLILNEKTTRQDRELAISEGIDLKG